MVVHLKEHNYHFKEKGSYFLTNVPINLQ